MNSLGDISHMSPHGNSTRFWQTLRTRRGNMAPLMNTIPKQLRIASHIQVATFFILRSINHSSFHYFTVIWNFHYIFEVIWCIKIIQIIILIACPWNFLNISVEAMQCHIHNHPFCICCFCFQFVVQFVIRSRARFCMLMTSNTFVFRWYHNS